MPRRRALVALLGLAAAALLVLVSVSEARPHGGGDRGGPDQADSGAVSVSGDQNPGYGTANPLVVENPICSKGLDRSERRNCRVTGTPEGRYPTSNYGLEVHIDTGIDNVVGNFQALLAHIANAIWMALLFVLNLVITLLGWAFELNPFGDNRTMGEISAGLERFYRAFTSPWLVAALVIVGAAGIWRGLVRRDAAGAIGGALLTVALMVAALWVIHDPRASVGEASELSNQAAQSVIAAPQSGSLRNPSATYAESTAEVWNAMTLPGFAALNFSNVDWALSEPDPQVLAKANETACLDYAYLRSLPKERVRRLFAEGIWSGIDCKGLSAVAPAPRTNAEIWLRNSPGSEARDSLWDEFTDEHPYSTYFAIQGEGGAWTRLPLVCLIAVGLLGGIALMAWLAIRIFVQTAVAFVLTLTTPLALFLPAFGEAGRRAFGFWGTTLLGSLVAKLVYAAILSVVLFATTVVASLVRGGGGVGALMSFLVMAALWWAVFLKREQLIAAISLPDGHEGGSGRLEGLTGLYAGMRMGGMVTRPLRTAAGVGVAGVAGVAAGGFLGGHGRDRAEGTSRMAAGQLGAVAARRLDSRYSEERAIAEREVSRRQELARIGAQRRDLLSRARGGADRGAAQGNSSRADPHERVQALAERQRELRSELAGDEERARQARLFLARADERERSAGSRWSGQDLAQAKERIRREADRPIESGVHAWRVGMSPARYEALSGREREQAHRRVVGELRQDRLAFGAIPDRPEGLVERRAQHAYRRELGRGGGAEARRSLRGAERAARDERRRRARSRGPSRRGVSR